jgi:1-deoxy-D-xylulose-5-phosphate reductoisomerase
LNNKNRNIGILGSTGSIGKNTLNVVRNLNANGYNIKINFLAANNKIDTLIEQVNEFKPKSVFIQSKNKSEEFKNIFNVREINVCEDLDDFMQIIKGNDYDLLVNATVGFSGLIPTIEAIKSGKNIALANKETLVVAGKIINELLIEHKKSLLPIDSEHSAILQCLAGESPESVDKIILTASGGPFRDKTYDEIKKATIEDALKHPNWSMGNKITIDSATMMNKGLEVIEAKWLFNVDMVKIKVVIHPQSIIHSMVEFNDGSIKAQLGIPDMRIPIQYALTYPERVKSDFPKMDFSKYRKLTFEEPDPVKFECLQIAYDVLKQGGTYPVVLNASNEVAVELFLKGKIKFFEIPDIIKNEIETHNSKNEFDIEDIKEIDRKTRNEILNRI